MQGLIVERGKLAYLIFYLWKSGMVASAWSPTVPTIQCLAPRCFRPSTVISFCNKWHYFHCHKSNAKQVSIIIDNTSIVFKATRTLRTIFLNVIIIINIVILFNHIFCLLVSIVSFSLPYCKSRAGEKYKCLVPIYVFPEMKLCSLLVSKTQLKYSLSQFLHYYICERFIYFQDRSVCLLQPNMWTDPGNI